MTADLDPARTVALLQVVAEGNGRYDARQVDLVISSRLPPEERTVLDELTLLLEAGLIYRYDESGAVGYRWALTEAGEAQLAGPSLDLRDG